MRQTTGKAVVSKPESEVDIVKRGSKINQVVRKRSLHARAVG